MFEIDFQPALFANLLLHIENYFKQKIVILNFFMNENKVGQTQIREFLLPMLLFLNMKHLIES